MEQYIWNLLFITLTVGSFGGIINYLITADENKILENNTSLKGTPTYYLIFKSIIIGIGASMTVPLFLHTISSEIIDKCKNGENKYYLIYGGFCIIASVFSRRFLDTVAEKALKSAEKAENTSQAALEQANVIAEKLTESDVELEDDSNSATRSLEGGSISNENKIISIFQNSKYIYRTTKGIAKDLNEDEKSTVEILKKMQEQNIVMNFNKNGKSLWKLINK